ncbi:ImmA/IrrE family metallo-endopeptidase [Hephaestia mangrovi]|uniref:ImmA/IrrE family metallo-endopeptidase n=1 Tax=Hephaestia mangrovi TaxID=2873268 RepID=UPI001CA6A17C|nr:ImmA/IrrE family metallo-endopeptidase [Hephaestia mangrovi]MBY8828831.1 ImmA/IrrE family metallo-endopeptidase [Hephaestia mangrovi]
MSVTLSTIPQEAAKLARRGFNSQFPVPVEAIIKRHKIKIELASLPDDLSGMSFVKDGVAAIVVNLSHHINRRRFTLAHELGHHLLHASYLNDNVHVDRLVLNRDKMSATGEDQKERDANAFAAELLMPLAEIKKICHIDINDDEIIAQYAKRFKVSASALTYRIMNVSDTIIEKAM